MMQRSRTVALLLACLWGGWAAQAEAQVERGSRTAEAPAALSGQAAPELTGIGLHGGLGTDVSLGLAYGAGVSYAILPGSGATVFEIGPDLFISNSTYEGTSGNYRYTEKTALTVFGVRANSLFNYHPGKPGVFWIVGTGIAAVSVEWTYDETNIIYPDVTMHDSAEGTTASWIVNLGFGATFAGPFEIRLETPILFMFGAYGNAAAIAPAFTVVAGLRF